MCAFGVVNGSYAVAKIIAFIRYRGFEFSVPVICLALEVIGNTSTFTTTMNCASISLLTPSFSQSD
jgi:hypothetical protein